jgi:hypothetical protein
MEHYKKDSNTRNSEETRTLPAETRVFSDKNVSSSEQNQIENGLDRQNMEVARQQREAPRSIYDRFYRRTEVPWKQDDISVALKTNLDDAPEKSWFISDFDSTLCVFISSHEELGQFGGSFIDYKKKIVVKQLPAMKMSKLDPNTVDFPENAKFIFPYTGSRLDVFMYEGRLYIVTTKTLGTNKKQGNPDYAALYRFLKGPSQSTLFRDDINNNWCYTFTAISPETSHVSHIPYNCEQKLVYTGCYPMGSSKLEPHYRKAFETNKYISKDHAFAIYNGDTSYSYAGDSVYNGKEMDQKMLPSVHPDYMYVEIDGIVTKYESPASVWRSLVRSNTVGLAARVVKLMFMTKFNKDGSIEFVDETFTPLKSELSDVSEGVTEIVPIPVYTFKDESTKNDASAKNDASKNDASKNEGEGEKIKVISHSTSYYNATYGINLINLVRVVKAHMYSSISPFRHKEIDDLEKEINNFIPNVINHYNNLQNADSPGYVPAA